MLVNWEGIRAFFQTVKRPRTLLPHVKFPSFTNVPVGISSHLSNAYCRPVDIRGIVLDKDDCITVPNKNEIPNENLEKLRELQKKFGKSHILLVSNSIGSKKQDPTGEDAAHFEARWEIPVLRHSKLKPLCEQEVWDYFQRSTQIQHPSQLLFIGDRLLTDSTMANRMGAWSLWLYVGVQENSSWMNKLEGKLYQTFQPMGPILPQMNEKDK
ncbi:phosphatidylglycerol phosphate phosphatase Gep4 [Schizosaccharomyces osmophilus]|uniref:Phosphatidylglycerol phosphate phosphatase Gep4 n=1 Tax=Schizosaccharomyces osmophilus TaxID=2545709 RepID=A0AAE9WEX2_9SCHI|nr:phosphatidylglycerol phosphate phosphatase Gep4 [Schizosaccharomyces osmophilus]WBW75029.1 phosphatidylglycerol phosphate phosphatase Gep4 [Schizosaccharomyces osmophilus]